MGVGTLPRMSGRLLLIALTAAFVLAQALPAAAATVTVDADGASPEQVQAGIGETVVWTNASDAPVTLVSEDPQWTSGRLRPGESFSLAFDEAGTYTYQSTDGAITGEVLVVGSDGGSGAAGGDDGGVVGGGTTLPATGTSALLAAVAAALVTAGTLVLRRSATRRR